MEIQISFKQAAIFLFGSGILSTLAVVFGLQLATQSKNFDGVLGCLPGTQAFVEIDIKNDQREKLSVRCKEVTKQ